ncbi:MAG: SusC/RagA family TonB-linked outer membrane protein [Gemmatimonas sp.]|nr:SusC/RagA family TonB-linked outer membrane protein [Gemmatimonas sp.]
MSSSSRSGLMTMSVLLLSLLARPTAPLAAQTGTVAGQVIEATTQQPLAGAQVQAVGSSIGALTRDDGRFTLSNVPAGSVTVQAQLIGYTSAESTVTLGAGETVTVNFQLEEAAVALDEVVVTALAIEREAYTLGYATQTVGGDDINVGMSDSWVNGLQGQVAGLNLQSAGSGVMGTTRITLRGENSLNLSRGEALVVVDGVPINGKMTGMGANSYLGSETPIDFGDGISDLNPGDIESVTVLKGPSAAALYGSRASNGAIIITTKTAQAQQGLGLTYSGGLMMEEITRWPDYQTEFGSGSRVRLELDYYSFDSEEGREGNQSTHSWGLPFRDQQFHQYQPDTDEAVQLPWQARDFIKGYFETGVAANHNLSLSRAGDLGNFRLSLSQRDNSWIVPNTGSTLNTVDLTTQVNVNDDIRMNASGRYINRKSDNLPSAGYGSESPMYFFTWMNNSIGVDWLKDYWVDEDAVQDNRINPNADNPYFQAYEQLDTQDRSRLIGSLSLELAPTPNSRIILRTARDQSEDFRTTIRPKSSVGFPHGMYREQTVRFEENNSDFLLSYTPPFEGPGLLGEMDATLSVGGNYRDTYSPNHMVTAEELVLPGVYNLGNSAIRPLVSSSSAESKMYSLYSMLSLGRNWWFLDLTARNDWSSTLPTENNSYFYPSASLSVVLSELFDTGSALDFAKLRFGAAQVGNDGDPYRLDKYYSFHDFDGSLSNPGSIPNQNLKPEIVTSYEAGFDTRFFGGHARLDATFYRSESINQILNVPVDASTGFTSALLNAGQIDNTGIELMAAFTPVQTPDFQWNSTVNWATNRSEVVSLSEGVDSYVLRSGIASRVFVEARPGERFGNIYGRGYLRAPNGQIVHNEDGYPMLTDSLMLTGNAYPDWTGGVSNSFRYKGLTLNTLFDFRQGGDLYSLTYAALSYSGKLTNSLEGRYDSNITPTGVVQNADGTYSPNTRQPTNIGYYYDALYSRDNIEANTLDTSFLKLREVSLGFDLPQRWLQGRDIQSATVSITGRNLYTWSSFGSFDPEAATLDGNTVFPGIETGQFPSTTAVGFNVQVSF